MNFKETLLESIMGWNTESISDEWYLEKFRENQIANLAPEEAFNAINETLPLLSELQDETSIYDVIQILIFLAWQSETTEIPSELNSNYEILKTRIVGFGSDANAKFIEFSCYYRLDRNEG